MLLGHQRLLSDSYKLWMRGEERVLPRISRTDFQGQEVSVNRTHQGVVCQEETILPTEQIMIEREFYGDRMANIESKVLPWES